MKQMLSKKIMNDDMTRKFFHNLKGDKMLKFLSFLSVLQDNSSFCYRLETAMIKSYLMWRRGKYDWPLIDRILEHGNPQVEDPQERLFVEAVHTPIGSYKVFSAFYLTHKYLLSQLLFLAHKYKIDHGNLNLVYTILEISNVIADRYNYSWNVCGKYNAENVYTSNYKEYGNCESYNCFSEAEIKNIFVKYKADGRFFKSFILCLKRNEYEKEFSKLGHCDTFELHPFLKLNSGEYLVLFPANLLRIAYRLCYCALVKKLGEKHLLMLIEHEMIQETRRTLQGEHESFEGQNNYQNIPFLWFRFDEDKVANVAIVLVDKRTKLDQALKDSEKALNNAYPHKTIFTFLVTQEMAEESIFITVSRDITHFSIEELKLVMNQDRMNLLNLYYYNQDKKTLKFVPATQEIDIFAYYSSKHYTFYQDEMPKMMFVETGKALSLRDQYLCGQDEHMVWYAPQGSHVPVKHYADIPKQVPIYVPYMMVNEGQGENPVYYA